MFVFQESIRQSQTMFCIILSSCFFPFRHPLFTFLIILLATFMDYGSNPQYDRRNNNYYLNRRTEDLYRSHVSTGEYLYQHFQYYNQYLAAPPNLCSFRHKLILLFHYCFHLAFCRNILLLIRLLRRHLRNDGYHPVIEPVHIVVSLTCRCFPE